VEGIQWNKLRQGGKSVKINEVERAVGISKRNIRFYEKEGLLAPSRNNNNGYREYEPADVILLKKIKLLRKLAIPIEEILKIQKGILTTEDALRRHLIKLERDSKNLEQIKHLCGQMAQSALQLESMDPDKYLEEIEKMEKEGTRFMNINKDKKLRYSAIVVASVIIAFMGSVLGLLLWAFISGHVPTMVAVLILIFPTAVIIGVALALKQRMKEIKEGEENAAAKY